MSGISFDECDVVKRSISTNILHPFTKTKFRMGQWKILPFLEEFLKVTCLSFDYAIIVSLERKQ